jgi:fluoride exporter
VSAVAWWGWVAAVAAGSAGALLRTWLVRRLAKRPVPLGVLAANTIASAVGGAVVADRESLGVVWSLVLVGGFCGGLSTLSTLAADTVELWLENRRRDALGNVVANVAVGLAVVWGAWTLVS